MFVHEYLIGKMPDNSSFTEVVKATEDYTDYKLKNTGLSD